MNKKSKKQDILRKMTKKKWITISLVLLVIILIFVYLGNKSDNNRVEIWEVQRGSVERNIVLSGRVEPLREADLGFATGGRVKEVTVVEGDFVQEGDLLVELENSTLMAGLRGANAAYSESKANLIDMELGVQENTDLVGSTLSSAIDNLKIVISKEESKVANALQVFLSSNLAVYPVDYDNQKTPPTVSGSYMSDEQGSYTLSVYGSGSASGASFRYEGLESGSQEIVYGSDVPLGNRGLYVNFPSGDYYKNSNWFIPIPNTRSSMFTTSQAVYEGVQELRDLSIKTAENQVNVKEKELAISDADSSSQNIVAAKARLDAAGARVSSYYAQIKEREIRAPFDGIISERNYEVGEIIVPGTSVISILGLGEYKIELEVPEIDIDSITTGDIAMVTFDAFSNNEPISATVARVNQKETLIDGVPVYLATLLFDEVGDRVRSGMSVDAEVTLQEVSDTVRVPEEYLFRDAGGYYVNRYIDGNKIRKEVRVGVQGSNGYVSIIEGLSVGDFIIADRETD